MKIKQLFCLHEWKKIKVTQEIDGLRNVRYGIRIYACDKCGKISRQDSRYDRLCRKEI